MCGVLIEKDEYDNVNDKINKIKNTFWKTNNVILHSRDIRKCEKEFQILFDLSVKKNFYDQINQVVSDSDYTIIAAAIRKDEYIKKYGKQSDNVYGIALSFIIERTVYCLDKVDDKEICVHLVIEKRGAKEDQELRNHFQVVKSNGTYYVDADRINNYGFGFYFRNKAANINGLQLADLIAYPVARYVLEPERPNLSFKLFEDKIYGGKRKFGLKIFP